MFPRCVFAAWYFAASFFVSGGDVVATQPPIVPVVAPTSFFARLMAWLRSLFGR
jgi:hypothetical protein